MEVCVCGNSVKCDRGVAFHQCHICVFSPFNVWIRTPSSPPHPLQRSDVNPPARPLFPFTQPPSSHTFHTSPHFHRPPALSPQVCGHQVSGKTGARAPNNALVSMLDGRCPPTVALGIAQAVHAGEAAVPPWERDGGGGGGGWTASAGRTAQQEVQQQQQ